MARSSGSRSRGHSDHDAFDIEHAGQPRGTSCRDPSNEPSARDPSHALVRSGSAGVRPAPACRLMAHVAIGPSTNSSTSRASHRRPRLHSMPCAQGFATGDVCPRVPRSSTATGRDLMEAMTATTSASPARSTYGRLWRVGLLISVLPGVLAACAKRDAQDLAMAPLVPVAVAAIPPARSSAWASHVSAKPIAP